MIAAEDGGWNDMFLLAGVLQMLIERFRELVEA
jgi:hypothetical protein